MMRWLDIGAISSRRIVVRAVWGLALLSGTGAALLAGLSITRSTHGFVSHYTASRLVLEGIDGARLYDGPWVEEQVRRFEPTVRDSYGPNVPSTSLLLVPLAWLEYRTARTIWIISSFIALTATVLALAARLGLHGPWTPTLLSLTYLFQPVHENLVHGQMYIFVLVGLAVAWAGYGRSQARTLGAAVGALFAAKTAALMMWPLLVMERRWHSLGWATAVVLVAAMAATIALGGNVWIAYLEAARSLPGSPSLSVTAYQTLASISNHLLAYDSEWNPYPITSIPALARGIEVAGLVALVGISGWFTVRRGPSNMTFAAFVLLGLIASPVSLDYHYVIALLPIAILLADVRTERVWSVPVALFLLGTLLIAADIPYRNSRLAVGALALLAYPKLYGALLLWALALSRSKAAISRSDTGGQPASANP